MTEPAPLRRPLLLTGPPGAGKSAVAAALAAGRALCAVVEVDDVRALVRSGAVDPWRPGAGEAQHRLAAVQACLLAASFTAAGVEVVLCDVVRGPVAEVYRTSTAAPFVVALRVPLAVSRERAARTPRLTPEELHALHAESAVAAGVAAEVDATPGQGEVTAAVEALWAAAAPVTPSS
ncbi:hypothetical protein GB931_00040 [Modestobacter sp. I12A-02628]|uniref:Shikimate kinase n=1 Tax=Goekera deserti TaxID=2497753 RepID=A0A7K3WI59_9ACTN|nr:hypothetical protein [Goekera deserti]MPQ96337.1 hypothetical protein [Goekera deserti]NDI50505.1 hypothetical protein [Goekera deserti]NEL56181.1 hypothetical protein [Goekera deserti]